MPENEGDNIEVACCTHVLFNNMACVAYMCVSVESEGTDGWPTI